MNYAKQMNSFEDYSDRTGLPAYAQLIYYKLFAMNNRAGWVEWFETTNHYLMFRAGIKDEKTLIKNRNLLKQNNLIDFLSGKKGQPTKYKLIEIDNGNTGCNPVNNPVNNPVINPVINPVKTPVETPVEPTFTGLHPVENPDICKLNTISTTTTGSTRRNPEKDTEGWIAVCASYQNNIHPISGQIEMEKLNDLLQQFGKDWVIEAIDRSVMRNKRSMGYIDAILKNWGTNGFDDGREKGNGINKGNGRANKSKATHRTESDWDNEPDGLPPI